MSGKFKKDVARSQTLSQISCFSGQVEGNAAESEFERSIGFSFQTSQDVNYAKNKKAHDFNQVFSNSKTVNSLRLSPCQAKSMTANLMNKLDIVINASSEYDLDGKDSVVESKEDLDIDVSIQSVITKCGGYYNQAKDSIFKQSNFNALSKNLQSSLFSASHLENSTNIQASGLGGLANLSTSQDQGFESRFNQMMNNLKVHQNPNGGLQNSCFGSNYSSKQLKEKDCSIIYNSCQMDMSCSVSQRIMVEAKRNHSLQQQSQRNTLVEEDEDNPMFSSNPMYSRKVTHSNSDRQKEIMMDYTEATISRLNYLNGKITELEEVEHLDANLQRQTRKYITEKLRLMKRAPFASMSISTQLTQSAQSTSLSLTHGNTFANSSYSCQNQRISSNQDFQTFHSNQPSIVLRQPHYISKVTLDIDTLCQRDVCLTTDESYTFVFPLDPHFPNVILVGTLTGKIQLYSLANEKPRKKYIQKLSQQIFKLADSQYEQVYPTCATQYKSNFFIGGSDGSVHLYDFKKKSVVSTYLNKVGPVENDAKVNNLEESIPFSFDINNLGLSSADNQDKPHNNCGVKNIKATSKKLLFFRNDGMVMMTKSNDLTETLFTKKVDGLLKCDFSCDDDNNILILTDEKLEIIHTPLNKTVFRLNQNIQEQLAFVDFQVNTLTKEVILLSNNQFIQSSRIQILTNKTTRLRIIETLSTQYILNQILLDKQMQNLFCIGVGEIKIWSYYNQNEFQNIQQSLLDKLSDPDDILTTNDSCN